MLPTPPLIRQVVGEPRPAPSVPSWCGSFASAVLKVPIQIFPAHPTSRVGSVGSSCLSFVHLREYRTRRPFVCERSSQTQGLSL